MSTKYILKHISIGVSALIWAPLFVLGLAGWIAFLMGVIFCLVWLVSHMV